MDLLRGQIYSFKVQSTNIEENNSYSILLGPHNDTHYFPYIIKGKQDLDLKVLGKDNDTSKYYLSLEPELRKVYNIYSSYVFKTIGKKQVETSNNELIDLIEVEDKFGIRRTVRPFDWQLGNDYLLPETISCAVKDINENTLYLEQQVTDNLKHPIFERNQVYNFKYINIIELSDSSINLLKIKGPDNAIYTVKAHFFQHTDKNINKDIECVFLGIDKKGNVLLEQTTSSFISFDKIFENDFDKEVIFKAILKSQSKKKSKLFNDYDNNENLWIFSFCEVIEDLIYEKLNSYNYDKASYYLDILYKAENWILNSGFLRTFKPSKRSLNKKVVKSKIERIDLIRKSIHYVLNYKAEKFLNSFLENLVNIQNYEDIKNDISIIYYIFYVTDRNSFSNEYLLLLIYNLHESDLLTKDFILRFKNLIIKRIQNLIVEIYHSETINNKKNESLINLYKDICKLSYTMALLNIKIDNIDHSKINSAIFYRYLSRLANKSDEKHILLKYSLLILNYAPEITALYFTDDSSGWDLLINKNITDEFLEKIEIIRTEEKEFKKSNSKIIQKALDNNQILPAKVLEFNKSYLTVVINGIKGILPTTHLNCFIKSKNKQDTIINVHVIEYFSNLKYFICTTLKPDKINDTWTNVFESPLEVSDYKKNIELLNIGDVITGVVKNIEQDLGVFVNIGLMDALIPVSEVSWKRNLKLDEHFSVGQVIQASIFEIGSTNKITLSTKSLEPEPWDQGNKDLKEGEKYIAQLVNIKDYGLFLDIKPRLTGLLHHSNLDKRASSNIDFKIGSYYVVTVESYDIKEKKISYSDIRQIRKSDINSTNISNLINYKVDDESNNIDDNIGGDDYMTIKKNQDFQRGFCLRNLAFNEKTIENKVKYLQFSKLLFSLNQSKHSYLTDAYIEYFKTIKHFNDKVEIENNFNESNETAKNFESNTKLISSFPEVNNLIISLNILSNFGNTSKESVENLISRAFEDDLNVIHRRLSKLVLSNNLISSEKIDTTYIKDNKRRIVKYLIDGVLELNELMDDDAPSNINPDVQNLISLIESGESKTLEFKSSLFQPIPTKLQKEQIKRLNNDIEYFKKKGMTEAVFDKEKKLIEVKNAVDSNTIKQTAMKTLTSFANSKGGTLLIGIEDNKNILGLKFDFDQLKDEDKLDGFKKLFDDTISDFIGNDFQALIEESAFIEIKNKTVFKVNILKSSEPIFLKKNSNGENVTDFYIRGEASARKLTVDEFYNYSKNRFA